MNKLPEKEKRGNIVENNQTKPYDKKREFKKGEFRRPRVQRKNSAVPAVKSEQREKTGHEKPKREVRRTPVRIIPLGGLNEIGKNMTVYEYGGDIIVVDCGMAFPGDDMYGIDCVIPDVSYLVKNRSRLRGLFLSLIHI
mgnify:CR=1 FL=1